MLNATLIVFYPIRKNRDPRSSSARDPRKKSPSGGGRDSEHEKEKRLMEMDLGSVFDGLDLPSFGGGEDKPKEEEQHQQEEDDNALGLPFKPFVSTAVAKEIDASIYSHTPLHYRLQAITVSGPDYADVVRHIPPSQVQQDPRLRKLLGGGGMAAAKSPSYNPRQSSTSSSFSAAAPAAAAPSPSPYAQYFAAKAAAGGNRPQENAGGGGGASKVRRDPRRRN